MIPLGPSLPNRLNARAALALLLAASATFAARPCARAADGSAAPTTATAVDVASKATATAAAAATPAPTAAAAATATAPGPAPAAAAAPAPKAPAWKLKSVEGTSVTSDQFKGKVLVVDFWATWCGPCVSEIPGFVDLQRRYGKEGLVVIGISLDQESVDWPAFFDHHGINYTVLLADETVAQDFGAGDVIPTTYIVDRSGTIRLRNVGALPEEEFEKKLLPVLREAAKS